MKMKLTFNSQAVFISHLIFMHIISKESCKILLNTNETSIKAKKKILTEFLLKNNKFYHSFLSEFRIKRVIVRVH